MNIITGIIGIAMLLAFLGVLMWWIRALSLATIVAAVVVLLVYDFVQTVRQR